jgi:kynurenine 3-monooxygenase
MPENKIIIVGAGLAGSLLAIYLARRGFAVDLYEARGDMRNETVVAGRSINLALSDRGIAALREVGMDEYMLAEAVPMYGRMIHSESGETKSLPYSGRKGDYINSVSRAGLNIALINEAEKYDGVKFHFNDGCVDFDRETGAVILASGKVVTGDTVMATDGAGSAVRQAMECQIPNFESQSIFLEHGYKELHIPPGPSGEFLLEKNVLHIWPRHQFMMIALPNFDGSFTCTLFLAHKGGNPSGGEGALLHNDTLVGPGTLPIGRVSASGFDQLTDESKIHEFFHREFPDAVPLMPTLVEDFFTNPTGQLGTLKCWPWHLEGKALLLGDSAHAMVPFYGQGMNCAFEDVRVLDSLLSVPAASAGGQIDWQSTFEGYSKLRKPNTDAIQAMAEENFYEMRDATADPVFQRKRALETKLEQIDENYYSKYSMVTFREDLPYSVAKEKGNEQDRLLMEICAKEPDIENIDPQAILAELQKL